MDAVFLLALTGLSVGALYFLLASGLGLIFGLMNVLSFAHGAFLAVCAYAGWTVLRGADLAQGAPTWRLVIAAALAVVVGGALAWVTEVLLIRPLYSRPHLDQLLVTMGLGLILIALLSGIWGPDELSVPLPQWLKGTTAVGVSLVPNDRFVLIAAAVVLYTALQMFLRHTRHGLIVRAGVENRNMVRALGIDVRRSFTLVFVLGGAAAGLGGVLAAAYMRAINPQVGNTFLLYAFIVLIIGGLGSLKGALVASAAVGLLQQFANYYLDTGLGDILAVAAMAIVLLVRPQGIFGLKGRVV